MQKRRQLRNTGIKLAALAILALLLTQLGCASTPTHESTGQYVDDSVITSKAKAKIAGDQFLQSFNIGVETYKGVVQLSGFVDSNNAAERAVATVGSIDGVRRVQNNLIVKSNVSGQSEQQK